MENKVDRRELKELMEGLSWYELMTSPTMIDLYVEHIREAPVPYECKDEEREKERHIKDFNRMLNRNGRAILKDLFSDIHINEPFDDRATEFAMRFSQKHKNTTWLYWLQEIIGYISILLMWYAFLDKDEPNSQKKTDNLRADKV